MTEYVVDEGTLELDGTWDDKSVTALTFPAGSQRPDASFSITRDALPPGSSISLAGYVDQQLAKIAKSCQEFKFIDRREATVADLPSEFVEFTWKTPDGIVVHQIQAVLILARKVLVLTGTAAVDKYSAFSDVFDALIMSFRTKQ
jgi:hypothetical protein